MVTELLAESEARPSMKRVILKTPPVLYQWKGPFEGWSRNWVRKHYWRVRSVLGSEEDAMQECALVFARCVARYGATVNNPAHMMALFKVSVAREFHTLAAQDGADRAYASEVQEETDFNAGPLLAAVSQASEEAQAVIRAVSTAPAAFLALLLDVSGSEDSDAALNRRFRRLLRLKSAHDVVGELRALLSQ